MAWPHKPDWADRFLAKVKINPFHPKGCHEWRATKDQKGYGRFWIGQALHGAHRTAWELAFGSIPEGWHILHHCDNPGCVRPDHLFLGTNSINVADRNAKGRARGCVEAAGETHPKTTLTTEQAQEIRAHPGGRGYYRKLAAKYGVTIQTVYNIRSRKTWKHLP
jgi:hypothetical protein